MQLQLKRPLIIFDIESTGISIQTDKIIELAFIKIYPNGNQESQVMRFNPGIPIPAQASDIHGIYDVDVADKPTFGEKAHEIAKAFEGCDFGGFNSNKFDFPMLVEEFLRCGVAFETKDRKFVDVQRIFHQMEQRNLSAAYRFYCDKELVDAHTAMADVSATYDVLLAQLDRYPELKNDIDFLHSFSGQSRNVDLAGRIVLDNQNNIVFNFGKHRGKRVLDIFKVEPSYYKWMMDGDFSLDTKRRLTELYIEANKK
jgi:DNA polymerase-3 subunit epsilon